MDKDVFFYSNSFKLTGKISMPESKPKNTGFPVVILSHGYGASKEEFGDFLILSGLLNDMGVAVLRFDFRGCGNSDYQLGRMLCSSEWKQDLENAVSFISDFPGVDAEKICLIGESMGASIAILAAAEDMRVKCVIALSPIADGFVWLRDNWIKNKSSKGFEILLKEIEKDRQREAVYGQSNLLRMSDALAYEQKYLDIIEELRKNFNDREFTYYVQYASIASILTMRPLEVIKRISPRPLMLMAGKNDGIVPWEKNASKLYKIAGEIKKLVVYDEGDHGLMAEPTRTETFKEISEWISKYLIAS